MPTPIPFAAYGAKLGRLRTAPTPHFATALLFLLAALVLLPLLAFIATALWLKSPTVAGIRAAGLWARCRNVAAKFRSEWRSLSEAWGLADLLYKLSWRPFQRLGFVSKPEGRHPVRLPHPRDFRKRTG